MTDVKSYKFIHSMLRVKDPARSIKFYEFLGLKHFNHIEIGEGVTLHFLAYDSPNAPSHGKHWTDREGVIELTHNHGTEDDPDFKIVNGNEEPNRGFGHVCISVDNLQAACERIEAAGYKFQKKLTDGKMKDIAFALDPDGYWVEIIGQKDLEETKYVKETDVSTYRMNHTMIRVKDRAKSIKFYEDVLGMKVKKDNKNPDTEFDLIFMGYGGEGAEGAAFGANPDRNKEGLLEMTYNYGTEKEEGFKYCSGNEEGKQGYGHICVSVDDLDAACKRLEELGVEWEKRLTDGNMKDVAFIHDPDGYWVEIIQNESIKKRAGW